MREMPRSGQISLAHFCALIFLVALAVAFVCQAAVQWRDPWAHEFVISPLLYGAAVLLGVAIDRLRSWLGAGETPASHGRQQVFARHGERPFAE